MHCKPRHTPKIGMPSRVVREDVVGHPRILGTAGSGTDQDAVGGELVDLVDGERVVAVDDGLGTELTEVLDEVVDERVVVVDHENAGARHRRAE